MTAPMDDECRQLVDMAKQLARAAGHRRLLRAHLLLAAAGRGWLGSSPGEVLVQAAAELAAERTEAGGGAEPRLGADVLAALSAASARASANPRGRIRVRPAELLQALGVTTPFAGTAAPTDPEHALLAGLHEVDRSYVDLIRPTGEAGDRQPPTRRQTLERTVATLCRLEGRHVALVGPLDADPDTVVRDLAEMMDGGLVPGTFRAAAVVQVDVAGLVSGTSGPDYAEQRLLRILAALGARPQTAVVYLRHVASVLEHPGAAARLSSGLQATSGGVIAWLSVADHRRLVAVDDVAARAWQAIPLQATSPDETVTVLRREATRYAQHHQLVIADETIRAAVRLAARSSLDRSLPGSARDLLDEAAAHRRVRDEGDDTAAASMLAAEDVLHVLRIRTGVPLPDLIAAGEVLDDLDGRLARRVVGQAEAVGAVTDALRRAHAGVADPRRPLGSFLFLGPTGVGKTELARSLADELFGAVDTLVRLDMGEYQESHSVARLVGAPPGYVGYGQEGALAEILRRRPYSVILLDEIEKAHSDVHNALLAVLEEGRLADGQGRLVDARHCLIVMTSNLGSEHILDRDLLRGQIQERVTAEVRRSLPPEFLNRIDDQIVFNRLDTTVLEAIVELEIARLAGRLAERGLALAIASEARRWLVLSSYDPAYGARPLQRAVRQHVETPIAHGLVDLRFRSARTLQVHVRDDGEGLVVRADHRV